MNILKNSDNIIKNKNFILWHKRLGHYNNNVLKQLNIGLKTFNFNYHEYIMAKATINNIIYKNNITKYKKYLNLIQLNIFNFI